MADTLYQFCTEFNTSSPATAKALIKSLEDTAVSAVSDKERPSHVAIYGDHGIDDAAMDVLINYQKSSSIDTTIIVEGAVICTDIIPGEWGGWVVIIRNGATVAVNTKTIADKLLEEEW